MLFFLSPNKVQLMKLPMWLYHFFFWQFEVDITSMSMQSQYHFVYTHELHAEVDLKTENKSLIQEKWKETSPFFFFFYSETQGAKKPTSLMNEKVLALRCNCISLQSMKIEMNPEYLFWDM